MDVVQILALMITEDILQETEHLINYHSPPGHWFLHMVVLNS